MIILGGRLAKAWSLKKRTPFRSRARARKGERKLCSRLVVKVDSRVILSSVVGRGEDATAGHVASTLNIFINFKPKPRTFGF